MKMKYKFFLFFCGLFIITKSYSQSSNNTFRLELNLINGQYDSVIYIANTIINNDSTHAMAYYYQGKAFQAKYKFFDAERVFTKAYILDSLNKSIQNSLAETYDVIGKDEEAINIYFNQYQKDTTDISPIINLANIFRKKGEYGSAIYYYQKAIAIDPGNFYNYKLIANCFNQINLNVPAILYYNKAIEINPFDLDIYVLLANILNSERQFQTSIILCKKGLEMNMLNVQLKKLLAYSYYLNKDFSSSINEFEDLISHEDSTFFNFKYLGLANFENKNFENAIHTLRIAYSLEHDDTEVTFFLGSALGRMGEYFEGIQYLRLTLNLLAPPQKEMASIYSEMAVIEQDRKDYNKAMEYLKLAYQSQPDPIYSMKMGLLYDQYLSNKKLAINYYDGYLTMLKVKSQEDQMNSPVDSIADSYKEYAKQRIQILTEELFFEEGK